MGIQSVAPPTYYLQAPFLSVPHIGGRGGTLVAVMWPQLLELSIVQWYCKGVYRGG